MARPRKIRTPGESEAAAPAPEQPAPVDQSPPDEVAAPARAREDGTPRWVQTPSGWDLLA